MTIRMPVIYRDEDFVAVDKPAGVPPRSAAGDPYPGDALRATQSDLALPYLATPQRPDPESSGVLLFAARSEANDALSAAFGRGAVQTIYLAIVEGAPPAPSGRIDAPIAREPGETERYRVTTERDRRGQHAVTSYRLLETSPDGRYSLLDVTTAAASSHPLRAHLAHVGLPVLGDGLYPAGGRVSGGPSRAAAGPGGAPHGGAPGSRPAPGQRTVAAPRLALHAARLTFTHPATGQPVPVAAERPRLFRRLASGLPEMQLAASARPPGRLKPASPATRELLALALDRRAPLAAGDGTSIYRLVNGAADGFPGLTVDRYGRALVLNIYAGSTRPEPVPTGLSEMLAEAAGATSVYVKYRQREAARVEAEALPAFAPARPLAGPPLGEFTAYEDGLAYLVRPGEGWNPGIYPDMREMRGRVRAWARGRRILNCFAYTCGLGLAAVAGGATQAVNLDVSRPLLERGRANYHANGFDPRPDDFIYGDAFDWLPRLAQAGERFDLVILDPPGFARTKTHTWSAAGDYGRLAAAAAAVAAPGGMLVACCNVADLSWRSFRDRVTAGLDEAWRASTIAGAYGAPVLDYPNPSGRESPLKILICQLD